MRVPAHVVTARHQRLAEILQGHGYLPVGELVRLLGVSEATIRRDLARLARDRRLTRTYGGALADFNARFPSFAQRRAEGRTAKRLLARRALALLQPGWTIYLDSGTTTGEIAHAVRERPVRPLTVVTNNLAVLATLGGVEGLALHLLAGELLPRQSVLLGEAACRSAAFHDFDAVFLSAEGMTADGLWNSTPEVVALQIAAAARTRARGGRTIACLDRRKLGRTAPVFLGPWSSVDLLLTDATPAALDRLAIPAAIRSAASPSRPAGSADATTPAHPPASAALRDDSATGGISGLTLPTELL